MPPSPPCCRQIRPARWRIGPRQSRVSTIRSARRRRRNRSRKAGPRSRRRNSSAARRSASATTSLRSRPSSRITRRCRSRRAQRRYEKALEQIYMPLSAGFRGGRPLCVLVAGHRGSQRPDPCQAAAERAHPGEGCRPTQPQHPGVVHFLIHAYDFPSIAEHGIDAARRYAAIAPDSPHALHMPSHIFSRVGSGRIRSR